MTAGMADISGGYPNPIARYGARRGYIRRISKSDCALRCQARIYPADLQIGLRVTGPGADISGGYPNPIARYGARRGYIRRISKSDCALRGQARKNPRPTHDHQFGTWVGVVGRDDQFGAWRGSSNDRSNPSRG